VTDPFGLIGTRLVQALMGLPRDELRAAWESRTISPHSPGPVRNEECVVHVLDQPVHVDEDRQLKPAAFTAVVSLGLSVQRLAHCTEDEVVQHAQQRNLDARQRQRDQGKPDDGRYPVALLTLKVAELRTAMTLEPEPRRVMGVYDSGLRGGAADGAHADVVAFKGEAVQRRARKLLRDQAKLAMRWL